MSRLSLRLLLALGMALLAGAVSAQNTPVGLWKTIDDESGKEKAMVRVSEAGGVLSGRIERLLDPDTPPDAVCKDCIDERKDLPILGLTVIRNVKQSEADKNLWDSGDILDPSNGKVYRVRLKPIDGGAKLEVRGYIGTPLFGRTQTWMRAE